MKLKYTLLALASPIIMNAQDVMTPEKLWTLGKLSVQAVAPNDEALIYQVAVTHLETEKDTKRSFWLNLKTQKSKAFKLEGKKIVQWDSNGLYARKGADLWISRDQGKSWKKFYTIGDEAQNIVIAPDGKKIAFSKKVHVEDILGKDLYKDLPKSEVQVYTDLNNRHWDTWYTGEMDHVFVVETTQKVSQAKDLLKGKKYASPQQPFGGKEDFLWSPDSQTFLYITKEAYGSAYAQSTNTDIFAYDLKTQITKNITQGMPGYDVNPKFSPDGKYLSWRSMDTPGYEADKVDLVLMNWKTKQKTNLTQDWDESVDGGYFWADNSEVIYFNPAYRGVRQLFKIDIKSEQITQITDEHFDVNDIFAETQNSLFVSRVDFNHNADLFKVDLKDGDYHRVTDINKAKYAKISPSKSELKMIETTDGKQMGVWFIYPPNFDPQKKYPTLLYAQGGPQSALTQFFSLRWNFALMAANGYIVVAPNRRGMPGWGVEWNRTISGDWGGQPIQDYLAAADYAKSLPYVDADRMGAVGASYGGYSVFMLAGVHNNRFKTFIAHDGLFDTKSWYGTTEELWFANFDFGGAYWKNPQPPIYTKFNPSNYVKNWNRPILIIQGGKDFRVGYEQGQEAFQAAKLLGLKAKMLYFPNENHWVLHPQNGLVWQREFFKWLKETL